MRSSLHRPALLSAAVAAALLAGPASAGPPEGSLAPETVLARVGGVPIRYEEIRLSDEELQREAAEPVPDLHMEEIRRRRELRLLEERIRELVYRAEIERLGIEVPDAEVRRVWRERFLDRGLDPERAARAQRERLDSLLAALDLVRIQGLDEEEVWREHLSDVMAREEWLVHLERYGDLEHRGELEELAGVTAADLQEPAPGLRATLEHEALMEEVDRRIAAEDPDYAAYLDARSAEEDAGLGPRQRRARALWWRERMAEADLEILVGAFAPVEALLLAPVPAASAATDGGGGHVRAEDPS